MDIYKKINDLIKKLERSKFKTISSELILQELKLVAELFLDLNCISDDDKAVGSKLWNISHKTRQPKNGILKVLRLIKKILSSYDIRKELENYHFKPGKVIIFTAKQNYSAYDRLKILFASAVNVVDIIDPYLNPDTFQIFKKIPKKLKIRLITDLRNFYKDVRKSMNIIDTF